MPDDTTAPVTAEGLRERLAELLATPGPLPGARNYTKADAVLALLAGDPGDLPARMAEAIGRVVYIEPALRGEVTAAAMSVRWEHAASQAAELERLRATVASLDKELGEWKRAQQRSYNRLRDSETQMAELEATNYRLAQED